jgi:hypothetical protein
MNEEVDEPLPHTFVIPVNETTQDIILSRVISYECAKNYFRPMGISKCPFAGGRRAFLNKFQAHFAKSRFCLVPV